MAAKVNRLLFFFPFLRKKMQPFADRIGGLSKTGIASLNEGTLLYNYCGKEGFRLFQKQSIAHALQNIWLSATAAGLGFSTHNFNRNNVG